MMMKWIAEVNAGGNVATATAGQTPLVSRNGSTEGTPQDSVHLSTEARAWSVERPELLRRIADIRKQIEAGTYATDEKINAILGDIQSEIHQTRPVRLRA
ncbi:MAG: flagellar biosynthesis anti-sigma factor FlgM [Phycisphaerae bacterium]